MKQFDSLLFSKKALIKLIEPGTVTMNALNTGRIEVAMNFDKSLD